MTLATQLWPPVQPRTLQRQVWDSTTARAIPHVGRALGVYEMATQCALLQTRGGEQTATVPRLLERPDPDQALPTFLAVHLDDYLLHGNACHLITSRDAEGYPASVRWFPAGAWTITPDRNNQPVYHLYGREVPREQLVHVQRGADPAFPWRGVGVVEQHLATLDRAGLQGAAESANLRDRGMPSVAIIKPNGEPDPVNDDLVATKWVERFSGPVPKPGIFPAGTTVTPLSWNPNDQQMIQARAMSLKDVANAFNLDAYWLNAEGSSHTYKSPGPMFLSLLRISIGPVLAPFEDVWSFQWLPRGRKVLVDRTALLRDDLETMVRTFVQGRAAGLFTDDEARAYLGWPALTDEQREQMKPPLAPPAPEPEPVDDDSADNPAQPDPEAAA